MSSANLVRCIVASSLVFAAPFAAVAQTYDLVIAGGRVMDPAANTEKVTNIGVAGGTIAKISTSKLKGKRVINATGKTVIPGFIDLHTHSPFPFGEAFQVQDGVTTALDLELGAFPVSAYGEFLRRGARANYGASIAHALVRIKVIEGKDQPYLITIARGQAVPGAAFSQKATAAQIEQMRKLLQKGIDEGGLGIGFLLDYMSPAVSDAELRMVMEVAAKNKTVVWAHIRRGINGDIKTLKGILKVAEETGAKLHICHINANAMGNVAAWLKYIDEANARGADISSEIFPYTAGSTSIKADVFDRDWQKIFGITYGDVQWAETGEYFTKESWERIRRERPDSNLIHHYMKDEWLKIALRHPGVMVATDAMPAVNAKVKAAPNGAGSYTRLLAKFVRDDKVLPLMDAVARSSYLPAKRLAEFAPAFKKKGRIQEGADADLLIFELNNLKDHATYTKPYQAATGWDHVIVNGKPVITAGKLIAATPGLQIINRQQ